MPRPVVLPVLQCWFYPAHVWIDFHSWVEPQNPVLLILGVPRNRQSVILTISAASQSLAGPKMGWWRVGNHPILHSTGIIKMHIKAKRRTHRNTAGGLHRCRLSVLEKAHT
jgi:hypothetical protein